MTSLPTIDKSCSSARVIVLAALVVLLVFAGASLWWWPHQIGACGGIPVPGEIVISVPQFFQGDPRWANDPLGDTPRTLGGEGCAVASASMLLSHYGMDVDPGHLNVFLKQHNGYEGAGWLRWESRDRSSQAAQRHHALCGDRGEKRIRLSNPGSLLVWRGEDLSALLTWCSDRGPALLPATRPQIMTDVLCGLPYFTFPTYL